MSINNLDYTSYNYLTNLASVNANEVNTDVLTKSDPDISDLQFDMLEGISTNETIQQQIDGIVFDVSGVQAQIIAIQGNVTVLQGNVSVLQGNVTVLQGNVSVLQGNVSVLQGQMTTANSNISTLQGQMSTANSNISTLQGQVSTLDGEMNTAQSDIIALYSTTAASTAAIAGLSISQAAQDVTIAAHTVSIAALNTDVFNLQGDVTALEVKTTDQSWGSLTGTTFSSKVNVGGVTLNLSTASTFNNGISASAAITTTSTISSTSGTSQVSSLLVNNNFEVTNSSFFGDTIYVDRAVLTNSKKMVLYDNSTGNDYDYLGFWTDSGAASKKYLNAEIDGVTGSAFQWYYGNNLGSSRTLAKSLSSADEINYTPQATFLKSAGASQQIQLVRDTANNKVRIDMIGDIAGANTFDGQIIQQEGNGVDDNRGIMTIQSGDVTLTAQTSATTGTLQMNTKVLDINASGAITIDGATTTTLTSVGETEINSAALDINASAAITIDGATTTTLTSVGETEINSAALDINASGAITIDGASTTIITSIDDLTIQTTNPFGDILVTSAGTNTLTSVGQTTINSAVLDINASGAITIDGATTTTLTSIGETEINSAALDINASGAITIDGATTTTLTSIGETEINSAALDINASGAITIDGATTTIITSVDDLTIQTTNPFGDILVTSAGTTTLTSAGQTQINSVILDINATGAITIDGATTTTLTSIGETEINSAALDINASGAITIDGATTTTLTSIGETEINSAALDINASGAITIDGATTTTLTSTGETEINSAALDINASGNVTIDTPGDIITTSDELIITTNSLTSGIVHNSAASSNWDMDLKNALNAYGIRLSETGTSGLTILGVDDGVNQISSNGVNSSLNLKSDGDIGIEATDIVIEATGTSSGSIDITANEALDLVSTLDAINLTSGLNTNINAVTIKLDATTQILHHIGGVEVQEIGASGIINNPTGSITNQISGVDKLTISSTTVAVVNNLTVSQTNYTQPMSSAFQLGYTNTATSSAVMTGTLAQRATFTIPEKGVWLIVLGYQWTGGATNTITLKQAVISETTASATPAAPGLRYYEAIDTAVTAVLQLQGTIMGVYTATASTTLYLNALATVSASTFPTLAWSISWTRIG